MLESLRCPSCSTRFGLRASRVHAGIRRARCFKCDTVFGIEETVARLLPAASAAAFPEPIEELAALEPLPAAELQAPFPVEEGLERLAPEGLAQERHAEEVTEIMDLPPSLNLGDLEGTEDAPYANAGPNYASARDAIAKLMGTAPHVPTPPRSLASRSSMDVEATLNALDNTLGGAREPEPQQQAPKPQDMASTVRLSSQEIQAALASAVPAPPAAPQPRAELPLLAPAPSLDANLPQDPNLLKIQLEQETCNNVTTEQMASWIEQGRVHEYHMVARQFSDHWIEASKVPALRPIFEQRRRTQNPSQDDLPIPPAEILPPKKSLFGGLFGRN